MSQSGSFLLLLTLTAHAATTASNRVYSVHAATWFEEIADAAVVSPDGRWAAVGTGDRLRVVDLSSGLVDPARLHGPLDIVESLVFDAASRPVGSVPSRASARGTGTIRRFATSRLTPSLVVDHWSGNTCPTGMAVGSLCSWRNSCSSQKRIGNEQSRCWHAGAGVVPCPAGPGSSAGFIRDPNPGGGRHWSPDRRSGSGARCAWCCRPRDEDWPGWRRRGR